jgi:hypothetical protein
MEPIVLSIVCLFLVTELCQMLASSTSTKAALAHNEIRRQSSLAKKRCQVSSSQQSDDVDDHDHHHSHPHKGQDLYYLNNNNQVGYLPPIPESPDDDIDEEDRPFTQK